MVLQGPHHAAEQSTMTLGLPLTVDQKVSVLQSVRFLVARLDRTDSPLDLVDLAMAGRCVQGSHRGPGGR